MDNIWAIFGQYLNNIWTIFGQYSYNIWTIFGKYLDNIWIISEKYLNNIWTIFGQYLDNIWTQKEDSFFFTKAHLSVSHSFTSVPTWSDCLGLWSEIGLFFAKGSENGLTLHLKVWLWPKWGEITLKISCFEYEFNDALIVMRGYKKRIFLYLRLKSDFFPI